MSKVIQQSKKIYQRAILVESIILIILYTVITIFEPKFSLSFLLGALAGFIPQLGFVGYIFYFVEKNSIQNRVKILYQSEAVKIGLNIFLFALLFLLFKSIEPIGLFVGYLGSILFNSILPLFFSQVKKTD